MTHCLNQHIVWTDKYNSIVFSPWYLTGMFPTTLSRSFCELSLNAESEDEVMTQQIQMYIFDWIKYPELSIILNMENVKYITINDKNDSLYVPYKTFISG